MCYNVRPVLEGVGADVTSLISSVDSNRKRVRS